ncbi:hypothetical protein C5B96_03940 [Subtercola sp. Z020]|nr:hypothetical protein C5B96_03940 [Subtercola sp. Z020]
MSTPADLRLVVPAAAAWLAAAVLIGLPAAVAIPTSLVTAAALFGLALLTLVVAARLPRTIALCRRDRTNARAPGMSVGRRRDRTTARAPGGGAWRGRAHTAASVLALSCAAGGLVAACVAAQLPARAPSELPSLLAHTLHLRLSVTSAPVPSDAAGFSGEPSFRFGATASEVTAGATHLEGRIPMLVFLRGDPAGRFAIGDGIEVIGRLVATDPGETVSYLLYVDGTPDVVERAPWFLAWANGLRESFRSSAAQLPGDGAQLVPGLAIGDVSLVGDELNDEMITSGLSHLTAVSGANCAIVVAAIMLLGGALHLSRRWRIALSLLVMVAFVVLVTSSSSVLRAAVMAAIVLVTLASGRSPKGLPALAFATIILLASDPWLARNYGLALSVLATGGLLLLTRPLQRMLSRWMPAGLSLVIAVPLAAQLACQPVLVLLSPSLSTYSVPANLLAEPAAPVATVVGLLSCLVGALVPPLAPVGAWLTWVPASWIAGVAHFFATAPGASLPWLSGAPGVGLVLLLTAAALVLLFVGPTPAHPLPSEPMPAAPVPVELPPAEPGFVRPESAEPAPARPQFAELRRRRRASGGQFFWPTWRSRRGPRAVARTVAAAVLLLAVGGYLGGVVVPPLVAPHAWPENWEIAACDIGQGDAVVVRSPARAPADAPARDLAAPRIPGGSSASARDAAARTPEAPDAAPRDRFALVDVGPDPALLERCLDRLGIERIDLLVLTHYDLDHVGGLSAVLGRVSTVLMGPPLDAHDERMVTELRDAGAEVHQARRGDTGTLGDIGWSVLWPQPDTALRGNDASVTVQFDGAFRSLFLGDLGEDAQRQLARANTLTNEDVVKVAHHGSADQSEPLYDAITAEVGVVSVGADNRYGHPTDRLLGILARAGTTGYRTDRLGMIVLAPSADGIVVWSEGQARVEGRKK